MNTISSEAQKRLNLEKYSAKSYTAKVKIKRQRIPVNTYMVLLRSREIQRFYDKEYQERYIEQSSQD
jgi:hypothetical protein